MSAEQMIRDLTVIRDDEMDQDVFTVFFGTQELGHVRNEGDWGQERGQYAAWSLKTCATVGFYATLDEAVAAVAATHVPAGPGGNRTPTTKANRLDMDIMSFAQRVWVCKRAASLYDGTRTVSACWKQAFADEWTHRMNSRILPAEDTYRMCVALNGGKVHTAMVYDVRGNEYMHAACRTMDQNGRGTSYRYIEGAQLTCDKCIAQRDRREAHRARQA
jgi:hypothetical protein